MALTAFDCGLLAVQRQDYATGRAALQSAGDDAAALMLLAQLAGDGLGEPADEQRKRPRAGTRRRRPIWGCSICITGATR